MQYVDDEVADLHRINAELLAALHAIAFGDIPHKEARRIARAAIAKADGKS